MFPHSYDFECALPARLLCCWSIARLLSTSCELEVLPQQWSCEPGFGKALASALATQSIFYRPCFYSDINRWGRGFALGASQDEFATTLQRERSPGTLSQYVSIDTHVLGMVLTRSTQTSITEYMQEKLYEPLGMNHAGYWLVDGEGMEMALGGLNLTLVDFVKIGSLFLNKGKFNGQTIVPESWVESSLAGDEEHLAPTESFGYGYQWWLMPGEDREFMAMGVYGKYVYVNPRTRTVIAKLSANPFYNYDYLVSSDYAHLSLFRAISAAAVKTGLPVADSD